MNVNCARQCLSFFDWLAKPCEREKKTSALCANADKISHHIVRGRRLGRAGNHAETDQTVTDAAHALSDNVRLQATTLPDLEGKGRHTSRSRLDTQDATAAIHALLAEHDEA